MMLGHPKVPQPQLFSFCFQFFHERNCGEAILETAKLLGIEFFVRIDVRIHERLELLNELSNRRLLS
jgi:hypothetical protein